MIYHKIHVDTCVMSLKSAVNMLKSLVEASTQHGEIKVQR